MFKIFISLVLSILVGWAFYIFTPSTQNDFGYWLMAMFTTMLPLIGGFYWALHKLGFDE